MKAVQALLARSPTSLLLALASLGALGAQALLGLALVRFFSPEVAGRFAVVAQIAFFWITLALAQAPLQFLADAQRPADPRHAPLRHHQQHRAQHAEQHRHHDISGFHGPQRPR